MTKTASSILLMILVTLTALILAGSLHREVKQFAYGWLAVFALIWVLLVLAAVDLYMVARTQQQRKKDLLKDFRAGLEETFRKAKPPDSKDNPSAK